MAEYQGESFTQEEWDKKQQQQKAPEINAITGLPFGQAAEKAVQQKAQEWRETNPALPGTETPTDTRSTAEQGLDWLQTPLGTAALGLIPFAVGAGAGYGLRGRRINRQQRPPSRVDPTLADGGFTPPAAPPPPPPPPPAAPIDRNAQAAQRLADFEALVAKVEGARVPTSPPAPVAPAPQPATIMVDNPNRTSSWDPAQIEVPNPAAAQAAVAAPSAPEVPAIAEDAPKTALAIETQQPGSKVAEAVVLDELNKPAATPAPAPEPEKTVAGRTRRTQTQIAGDLAQAFAAAPPGMRPSAPQKTNKLPGDVIGQGGWHFYAGQGGTAEDWLRLYGRNPQPYSRVVADIKGGLLPVPPAPPGAKGGAVPRQPYVPEFIRGRADPRSLTGLGALAAAFGIAGSEQGREAMGRAAAAIKDIGISADLLQGKGEEMGRLGTGYVTAGNPAYLREINKQLETERDVARRAILLEEFQKAGGLAAPMR